MKNALAIQCMQESEIPCRDVKAFWQATSCFPWTWTHANECMAYFVVGYVTVNIHMNVYILLRLCNSI